MTNVGDKPNEYSVVVHPCTKEKMCKITQEGFRFLGYGGGDKSVLIKQDTWLHIGNVMGWTCNGNKKNDS